MKRLNFDEELIDIGINSFSKEMFETYVGIIRMF